MIYSPGPDLEDDDGALEQDDRPSPVPAGRPRPKEPYYEGKDIGFRLHVPAPRPKP